MQELDIPQLDVELLEHEVLSSFVWIEDIELTLIVARSGMTRAAGACDRAERDRLLLAIRSKDDVQMVGTTDPKLNTRKRYYGTIDSVMSDGMMGRPGRRSLQRSSSDRKPLDLDEHGTMADYEARQRLIEQLGCRDADCDGFTHGWLRLELEGGQMLIWHINCASGAVVPPRPMVLR